MRWTKEELDRYHRQMILPQVGPEGQERLKRASVVVVGAGGLGVPVLQYLVAAGVGRVGVVEMDRVEVSNLHRQVLYTTEDVGEPKALVAQKRLQALNPLVRVEAYPVRLTSENALEILRPYDLVVDASDNFPTRYLVNDAAVLLGKPLVFGAIYQFDGQVAVFHHPTLHGEMGPCYRCLFPKPPPPGAVPSCAEAGVFGVLPAVVGSLMAAEALKVLLGIGKPLAGHLLLYDAPRPASASSRCGATPVAPSAGTSPPRGSSWTTRPSAAWAEATPPRGRRGMMHSVHPWGADKEAAWKWHAVWKAFSSRKAGCATLTASRGSSTTTAFPSRSWRRRAALRKPPSSSSTGDCREGRSWRSSRPPSPGAAPCPPTFWSPSSATPSPPTP